MAHIGIFSPPAPGHMNPMSCLGRALLARGHRVTYFQMLDCEETIRRHGLDYAPIAEREFPRGELPKVFADIGARDGLGALRSAVDWFTRETLALFEDIPQALRTHAIDMALVDQATPAAYAAAEYT